MALAKTQESIEMRDNLIACPLARRQSGIPICIAPAKNDARPLCLTNRKLMQKKAVLWLQLK
jgi:hypothetical protein